MRVISGEARGRRLKAPRNQNLTRPMADKIKEAVFGSLASLGVQPVRILDLYAGSGAVGIEALSRGGEWADFVDRNREACIAVRSNLESTGFSERAKVHQVPVEVFLERVTEPYDFIVVDPPYANVNILEMLERISNSAAVEDETIVILGHWPKLEVPERIGRMVKLRDRCHGDSCFSIFDVVIEDEASVLAHEEGGRGMRRAIYPGSFDPITYGHMDIARRAARLFDEITIAIYVGGENSPKQPLFSVDQRVQFATDNLCHLGNVHVDTFDELLVDYAKRVGARTIVRGLRAVSDFEYEFKLAHMYQHLDPELEIICLMTSSDHSFISSSIIKEVASLGGSVDELVPPQVASALRERFPDA